MMSPSLPFAGRTAVVTGGGSGIGRCTCNLFASEGARVIVADIDLEAARSTAQSLPGHSVHLAVQVDVGCSQSVKALFKVVTREYGVSPSIVVNCAGILGAGRYLTDTPEDDFDDVVRVNLKGTFLVTQAAAQAMTSGNIRDGCIVNVASIAAKLGIPGRTAYCATKAGVVAMTKVVAKELAAQGIRVNVVLPDTIDTPLMAPGFRENTNRRAQAEARIPLGRLGRPEEVAEVIKFLCGKGSSFMSGAAVDISGGSI